MGGRHIRQRMQSLGREHCDALDQIVLKRLRRRPADRAEIVADAVRRQASLADGRNLTTVA